LTFDARNPAPTGRKTPEQLEADLIDTLRRSIDGLAPSTGNAWEAARRLLLTSLKTRVGVEEPVCDELVSSAVRRITDEGTSIEHHVIGRKAKGDAIPIVRLTPTRASGRLTIVSHPSGKAGLATAAGRPAPLVQRLLSLGQSVVGFDPLFVGEAIDSSNPVARRPDTVHFDTYNPTLAADQMQDLATVLAWSRSQADIREVNLVAQGLSGYQTIVARPVLNGLARSVIELPDLPEVRDPDKWLATIDLPGLEQFGGLKAAAALAAPSPVWLYGNMTAFSTSWPTKAYEIAGASQALRLTNEIPNPDAIARWIDRGD
jgi:hypothetical protein